MFGAVDAGLIMQVARMNGAMIQESLDLECPPWVFVKPDFLRTLSKGISVINANGQYSGYITIVDHPYFLETRDWLHSNGFIEAINQYINGDTVLKPFYFNNILLEEGERFLSASAMTYKFGRKENFNNGKTFSESKLIQEAARESHKN